MTWTKTRRDPLLGTHSWRVTIRKHWQLLALPCAVCHRPIDYNGPRYIPGTRRINPRSLVVGHIISRYQAKRLGWTEQQINSITNTRPECADCSGRTGARLAKAIQTMKRRHDDSHRW